MGGGRTHLKVNFWQTNKTIDDAISRPLLAWGRVGPCSEGMEVTRPAMGQGGRGGGARTATTAANFA